MEISVFILMWLTELTDLKLILLTNRLDHIGIQSCHRHFICNSLLVNLRALVWYITYNPVVRRYYSKWINLIKYVLVFNIWSKLLSFSSKRIFRISILFKVNRNEHFLKISFKIGVNNAMEFNKFIPKSW